MNNNKKIYLSLSALGIEMGLSLAICFFLGLWVDKSWLTAPWGVLSGGILGLITGLRLAYQKIKKIKNLMQEETKQDE